MSDETTAADEQRVVRLLDRAAAAIPPLSDRELALAARDAATGDRERVRAAAAGAGAPPGAASRPVRWALVLAAALAVALAGGIGIGRSLTGAAESAEAPVLPSVKPAFRPAAGWTVRHGALDTPPGTHSAVASSVPFDDALRAVAELPPDGIVVAVTARAGADAAERQQLGTVPLRLTDAAPATHWIGPSARERALAEYVLPVRAGPLDLDVRVYLGTTEPTRAQLASAQAQLDRLVLRSAANEVTISARPTTVRWAEPVGLSGAVAGGRAGERVMIEVRECGTDYWRAVDAATTTSGGQWSSQVMVGISGALRARTDAAASPPVRVSARPGVVLGPWRRARTTVAIAGVRPFWGRRVTLQRFDRARQRWTAVATARITKSEPAGNYIWSEAHFRTSLTRRGTLYRAVITNRETGPCYLAGFSNMSRR